MMLACGLPADAAAEGPDEAALLQRVADAQEATRRDPPSPRREWRALYEAQRAVETARLAEAEALAAAGDPEGAFWAAAALLQPGLGNLPGERWAHSPPEPAVGRALARYGAAAWEALMAERALSPAVGPALRGMALLGTWRGVDAQGNARCGGEAWPCPSDALTAQLATWTAEASADQSRLAAASTSEGERYLHTRLSEYFGGRYAAPRLDHRAVPLVTARGDGPCAAEAARVADVLNRSASPRLGPRVEPPGTTAVELTLSECDVGQSRDIQQRYRQVGTETQTRTVTLRGTRTSYTSGPGYVGTVDIQVVDTVTVVDEVAIVEEYQDIHWTQAVGLRGAFLLHGEGGTTEAPFVLLGGHTVQESDGATAADRHAAAVAHVATRERFKLEEHLRRAVALRALDRGPSPESALIAYALAPDVGASAAAAVAEPLGLDADLFQALVFASPYAPAPPATGLRLPWPTADPRDDDRVGKPPRGIEADLAACEGGDDHVCVEAGEALLAVGRRGAAADAFTLACLRAGLGCRLAIEQARATLSGSVPDLPWVDDVRHNLAELVGADCGWRGGTWSTRHGCVFLGD